MNLHAHFWLWCVGLRGPLSTTLPDERAALIRCAAGRERVAEIGVYHGATSRHFRRVMSATGTLVAVDAYYKSRIGMPAAYLIARRELGRVRRGRLVFLRATGAEAGRRDVVRRLAPFEFVFLDGDHSRAGLDANWSAWRPLVAPGGVIAIHDTTEGEGLRFVREVIDPDPAFARFDTVGVTSFFRRAAPDAPLSATART